MTSLLLFGFLVASILACLLRADPWRLANTLGHNQGYITTSSHPVQKDQIILGGTNGIVSVWNIHKGLERSVCVDEFVTCIDNSEEALAVATTSGRITLYQRNGLVELRKWKAHNSILTGLEFCNNGESLASVGMDACLRVWSVSTGRIVFELDGLSLVGGDPFAKLPMVRALPILSVSTDKRVLCYGDNSEAVAIVNTRKPDEMQFLKSTRSLGSIHCCDYLPHSKVVLGIHEDGHACFWDTETGALLSQARAINSNISELALSNDGNTVVLGSATGVIEIWTTRMKSKVAESKVSVQGINLLKFSLDNRRLFVGCMDNKLHVLDIKSGDVLYSISGAYERVYDIVEANAGEIVILIESASSTTLSNVGADETGNRPIRVFSIRHPEWWWGHFFRPEVWLALFFGVLWLIRVGLWLRRGRKIARDASVPCVTAQRISGDVIDRENADH